MLYLAVSELQLFIWVATAHTREAEWLDLQPVDIKSQWRHNWKSALVVNSHLVCDPTIRQPGFDLPRQQWSLLNRFRTEQGHCGACRRKWRLTDTDLCHCGETQMMSHIVESCPLTKLNGSLSQLHSALFRGWPVTSYGSWHVYEKKKKWFTLAGCLVLVHWNSSSKCLMTLYPRYQKWLFFTYYSLHILCDGWMNKHLLQPVT